MGRRRRRQAGIPAARAAPAAAHDAAAPSGVAIASSPQTPAREPSRSVITHPQAGQLTAGIWDDNRNFDFWKPYAVRFTEDHGSD